MSFFRRVFFHSPKRYITGLLLAAALTLLILYQKGFDRTIYFVDAFSAAGGIVFLIGLLQLVSYWGAFDTFGYGISKLGNYKRYADLYEYTQKKREARGRGELVFIPFLVVGAVFILISLIISAAI